MWLLAWILAKVEAIPSWAVVFVLTFWQLRGWVLAYAKDMEAQTQLLRDIKSSLERIEPPQRSREY